MLCRWKSTFLLILAALGWAIVIASALPFPPDPSAGVRTLGACMAVVCTAQLMLWGHCRPMVRAYDLGYENGRRDAIRGPGKGVTYLFADSQR